MFTADHIYERMQDRPFKPLRIITSSGEGYDVYHPELVVVGERFLFVGMASSRNPGCLILHRAYRCRTSQLLWIFR
jgi:hypothetical protein